MSIAGSSRAAAARPDWARALVAAYAFMALAACSRSSVQNATRFDQAPLAFGLSAVSGAIYLLAAVLAIGTWSELDPSRFLGLLWLAATRADAGAQR